MNASCVLIICNVLQDVNNKKLKMSILFQKVIGKCSERDYYTAKKLDLSRKEKKNAQEYRG